MENEEIEDNGTDSVNLPEYNSKLKYGGFQARMMANFIDMMLVGLLILAFAFILPDSPAPRISQQDIINLRQTGVVTQDMAYAVNAVMVNYILQGGFFIAVTVFCWVMWGTTPGKAVTALKIVDAKTGLSPSGRQMILRGCAYIVSLLPVMLGFFWIIFDKRKRGWHDKIAGTAVVVDWSGHRSLIKNIWDRISSISGGK